MAGTWGEVTVRRGPSGMPLIEAADEAAAFFGLGYAQACDDLEGLLRQFLLVRAELSLADPDAGARDDNQRRWRVHDEARTAYESLPARMQECYRAFTAGIAERVAEVPELVPAWAPPLDPWLPIGVNRTVMLFWVIADAVAALRVAGVELPPVVSELDRTPMTPGSNAWVLTPPRTADGATILVSDPHLPFGDVYAMHEATIVTPSLHYTGFTFLGAMLPALAHNDAVAWGCTTGGPRVSDAYRVPDLGHEELTINGLRSPVIARQDGWAYAICSPYTDTIAETESQLLAMLRTRSVAEFRTVLARRAFPPQNILAADRDGASLYVRTGRVPRRAATATGILDLSQTWNGYLDPDELVHLDGAPSGYLQNCNSAPDTVAPEVCTDDWHRDAFHDVPGRQTSRSERSIELLAGAVGVDAESVKAWAVEDRWPDTPRWREALAAAVSSDPARVAGWSDERTAFAEDLLAFDGSASPDSTRATAWLAWRTAVAQTPLDPAGLRALVDSLDPGLLLDAVERAAIDRRPYGDVHRMASGEPGRGGAFTVRPSADGDVQPSLQVPLRATYFKDDVAFAGGPALRIVNFDATGMTSWSLLLPRQAAAFSRGDVLPTPFRATDADVERSFPARAATSEDTIAASRFHPDLLAAEDLPRVPVRAKDLPTIQAQWPIAQPAPADVEIVDVNAAGVHEAPRVRLRLYRPSAHGHDTPVLYWMHGGGYLAGDPESDDPIAIDIVRRLGIVVVSVRYRLAPAHPAPAALEDAYSGLAWIYRNAAELGVDPTRVAIGGGSAGAGLAAALAQLTHDRAEYRPIFQLLVQPMLDDRTAVRTDLDLTFVRGWEAESNRFAWEAYLGQPPGSEHAPEYVVPARRDNLSGLPPAWLGVGTLDLFFEEDIDYARRLQLAGVSCETHVVPGAFHGFESIFPDAPVSRSFVTTAVGALAAALGVADRAKDTVDSR